MSRITGGIKQRYGPMKGFFSFVSAKRFCEAFDELRKSTRPQGGLRIKFCNTNNLLVIALINNTQYHIL